MNHFPGREIKDFVQSFNVYLLGAGAYQEGAHGPVQRTIISVVLPMGEVKIGPQLAVEAGEQVQVEGRRDALRVVVGRTDAARVFLQVEADEQAVGRGQGRSQLAQKIEPLDRVKVADVRPQKQHGLTTRPGTQLREGRGIIGHHRHYS